MLFAAHAITDREKEVLTLLVSGLTNKQIGTPLGIGARTVKAHISKILRKLGLHNRIELSCTPLHIRSLLRQRIDSAVHGSAGLDYSVQLATQAFSFTTQDKYRKLLTVSGPVGQVAFRGSTTVAKSSALRVGG